MSVSMTTVQALLLCTESEKWTSYEDTKLIPLGCIAYEPWANYRTKRCLEALASGTELPPIKVILLRLETKDFYSVSDGLHRCTANEIVGNTEVLATIKGSYDVVVSNFIIYQNSLWKKDGFTLKLITEEITDELRHELVSIGVEDKDQ